MSELVRINEMASSLMKDMLKKESLGIISAKQVGKNWQVNIEMLERRSVPDSQDLIGEYEVVIPAGGKSILSYRRLNTRRRGDTYTHSEEEK
ncbi:MAG: gas vesicle protein GvpO [Candidatus Aenigmarchaeota archaeon]|nr:gas vesicle protein GvpO [Candidatus Aenigmarchaeota archaeon]